MIGKAEWFSRRKYSGWGLTPKTWQGFLYIAVIIFLFVLIQELVLRPGIRMVSVIVLASIFLADFLHIMASIKLDEREVKIEAIAERNASWTMVTTSALVLIYFIELNKVLEKEFMSGLIMAPIITGLIAKASTNFYLQKKGI
jgi:hypothetical protein